MRPQASGKTVKGKPQGEVTATLQENSQPPGQEAVAALQQGISFHQAGQLELASQWYQKTLTFHPTHAVALNNLGGILRAQGKLDEAMASCQKAIAIEPGYSMAYFNLAVILQEKGWLDQSILNFQKALAIKPDYHDAQFNLGGAYKAAGQLEKAFLSFRKTLALKPNNPGAYNNLGLILHQLGRWDEAIKYFQKTLALQPSHYKAYNNYGITLLALKRPAEAIDKFQRAITIRPDNHEIFNKLGLAFLGLKKTNKAIACFQKALSIKPNYAEAWHQLGIAMADEEKPDEAIRYFKKSIVIDPNNHNVYNALGDILTNQGKLDEATRNYQKAITIKSDDSLAYYNLSRTRKQFTPAMIDALQALIGKSTTDYDQIHFNFALGKSLEKLERHTEAFQHYLEGNRLVRKDIRFSLTDETKYFESFMATFDKFFFESQRESGHPDTTPIFIVGMPRSGSSLIEQILSSHPEVHGGGELPLLNEILLAGTSSEDPRLIPRTFSRMDSKGLTETGIRYVSQLRKLAPTARFITDKRLLNFMHLGILRCILPKARIIHSQRASEDTCLSIFRTKFTNGSNFAFDLKEIGHYYRLYARIMAHWRELFPETFYEVSYESLTQNQEKETRRLLDYCGLEWHAGCLDFHKTERTVQTASNIQVRQPIYQSSVKGWKRYEKQLQPLLEALGVHSSS
ncbi:MAG: tetratricopeptide repeat protein [Magnetococcales bacterium]|nr:tetratricopeptide repeat protein [Magnetococcales bacterium]